MLARGLRSMCDDWQRVGSETGLPQVVIDGLRVALDEWLSPRR
jgi:hypothetical protein